MFRCRKIDANTRILVMNMNGFRFDYEEKIDQMTRFCKNNQTDVLMLSEKMENGQLEQQM